MIKFSALTLLLTVGLGLGSAQESLAQQGKVQPHRVAARRPAALRPTLMSDQHAAAAHPGRVADQFHSKPHTVHATPLDDRGTAPLNDDCSGAILLTVGTTCVPTAGTVLGATQSIAPVQCFDAFESSDDDVWYRFVATATTATIVLECNPDFDGVIDLRSGACNGTNIDCADGFIAGSNETINATGLTVGATYRFRVYDYGTGYPVDPTFNVCVFGTPPPPPNNNCANATTLMVNAAGACPGASTSGDNTYATPDNGDPACDVTTGQFLDVWYAFNSGSNTAVDLTLTAGTITDVGVELFEGSCAGASVFCDFSSTAYNVPVTANTNYRIRVYSNTQFGSAGTFDICVSAPVTGGPVNDLCGSVTPVALAMGGTVTFAGDNTDATITGDYAPGSDLDGSGLASVWHAFTTTECANIEVSYCGTLPAFQDVWIVLANSCPADVLTYYSSFNTTDCGSGNYTVYFAGLPAGTWYLPVMNDPAPTSLAVGPYSIDVTASPCSTPPANDNCDGAIMLDVNVLCETTTGTVFAATQSQAALLCNGFTGVANDDVWYSFIATGPNETISVTGSDTLDAVVELFTGGCNSPATLACADATVTGEVEEIVMNNLVEGNTYYVRVYDYYQGYPPNSTFTICVTGDIGTSISQTGDVPFGISPNPSNGDVRVTYDGLSGSVSMELVDLTGRVIYAATTSMVRGQVVDLQLSNKLSSGSYNLRLSSTAGQSVQRLIVR